MGYTQFYLDFLADKPSARNLFVAGNLEDVAAGIDRRKFDRAWLGKILKRQNDAFGAAAPALDNIRAFENDPRSLCVFCGQQAVLFGGPMLVIHKAIGIIKAARAISQRLDRTVIPIFWIAADDHDLDEVNHTVLLDRAGRPQTVRYETRPPHPVPVSDIYLSDQAELKKVKAKVREILGETEFTNDLFQTLDNCYTTSDSFVTAFGKLLAALLSSHGLVLFSPGDNDIKALSRPFFKQLIGQQDELHSRLTAANQRIVDAGYHLQVSKAPEAVHLFYNDDGRVPIHRQDDQFVAGERPFSAPELTALIDDHPERFSPDVITRPVWQSWLFPVVQQHGGPAELTYFAQLQSLFEIFEGHPPACVARPSVSILETRLAKIAHDFHISFADLTGDIEQVVNRVLTHSLPGDLERALKLLREDVIFHLEKFTKEALGFDPSLDRSVAQTFGKIDFLLKGVEGKTFASHKKKSSEKRDRIYRVHNALFPNRTMQERSVNVLYFLARYGDRFVSYLVDQIDGEDRAHQVIDMTEY
jgi:bacillithiol biosynthesis cysteine-adding enzyme BshC